MDNNKDAVYIQQLRKYCKDNNIKLLRIPYYDIENSENYKEILSLFVR